MAITPFTFTATRSGDVSLATSVHWDVVGTGSNAAVAGDFTGYGGLMPSGDVAWSAGNSDPTTITVNVLQDAVTETDKTFDVVLSAPTNGVQLNPVKTRAHGTIRNDD